MKNLLIFSHYGFIVIVLKNYVDYVDSYDMKNKLHFLQLSLHAPERHSNQLSIAVFPLKHTNILFFFTKVLEIQ